MAPVPRQSNIALIDDLHAAGFKVVAYDLATGRCTREWALNHVRERAEWWAGARDILERHPVEPDREETPNDKR